MKIIDIKGTAYERGLAQGRAVRADWLKMENAFYTSEIFLESKPKIVPVGIVKLLLSGLGHFSLRGAVKQHLPSQYKKVMGLSDGLGMSKAYTWGIHYTELMFCLSTSSLNIPPNTGCTQIHATPKATADGSPLTGRNYDFPNMLLPYQLLRREKPSEKGRLATMNVTQMPLAGTHQGLNEKGLNLCANNNRAWKEFNKKGVAYMMVVQEALETCSSAGQAVDFFKKFPVRANAGFIGVMDETGECCEVEFTAERTAVREPDDKGIIAQTNHFIIMKDANLPDGTTWNVHGMEGLLYSDSTKKRLEAAQRRMRENAGKITPEILMSILRDHSMNAKGEGDFFTVCCHGDAGSTLSSYVVDIRNRCMWVADGTPCCSEYVKVGFDW